MATVHEKLAASLEVLRSLQEGGARVFQSRDFKRVDRERLVRAGFLVEVMRGWFVSASPEVNAGDSTPWFSSFWEFCRRYCEHRFETEWYLSPEQSLLLHAESRAVPRQLIVYSPHGSKNTVELPFDTSLYDLQVAEMPPPSDLVVRDGLRLFAPEAALIKVPESFFVRFAVEAEVVLASIQDPSRLLEGLLGGGHGIVAGRLAGAFRRMSREDIADEIVSAMRAADHQVRESDPFDADRIVEVRSSSPIVARVEAMWTSARGVVLEAVPEPPGPPVDVDAYLRGIDEVYKQDAYHSLSIEGYKVTPELIERVASGDWDPDADDGDRDSKNALAARGYWLAFQRVRQSVATILTTDENPGSIVRRDHRDWYREMFRPHVTVGLLTAATLAGYRSVPVYLRGSRHVPPRWEVLREAMPTLFTLIENEEEPAVSAILGHWLLGYIHPFPDGNGRIARFLMNALLASGGYPWTVIRTERRTDYLEALDSASLDGDLRPFARFVTKEMKWSEAQSAAASP